MAPFGVEIDQIDEDAARRRRVGLERFEQEVDVAVVALALALLAGVAMGEDVADLADRDDRAARAARPAAGDCRRAADTAKSLRLAVRTKSLALRADEGPGDDAADVERIAEPARDAAEIIEPLEPEGLLVRGDLQHRVGRGVADRLQRPQVLLAVVLDDRRARGVAVGENARQACPRRSARRSALRERRGSSRENSPSRNRPAFRQSPNGRTACPCRARSRRHSPTGRAARGAQSPAARGRSRPSSHGRGRAPRGAAASSGPRLRPSRSPLPRGAGFGDMAERVGALVAVSLGVLRAAAADRIEDDENRAGHGAFRAPSTVLRTVPLPRFAGEDLPTAPSISSHAAQRRGGGRIAVRTPSRDGGRWRGAIARSLAHDRVERRLIGEGGGEQRPGIVVLRARRTPPALRRSRPPCRAA